MSRDGRPPVPRNLVLLQHGAESKAARKALNRNPNEPILDVVVPEPPEYLSERHKNAFRLFAGRLAKMKVMTEVDTEAVVLLAQSWLDYRDACDILAEEGPVIFTRFGDATVNPHVQVRNAAWLQVERMLGHCGLTPSGRRKVSTAGGASPSSAT